MPWINDLPYLGLYNAQEFAQILQFVGGVRIINRYSSFWQVGVSEWLLFNANLSILQLYHGESKFIFIEMVMRSALY